MNRKSTMMATMASALAATSDTFLGGGGIISKPKGKMNKAKKKKKQIAKASKKRNRK